MLLRDLAYFADDTRSAARQYDPAWDEHHGDDQDSREYRRTGRHDRLAKTAAGGERRKAGTRQGARGDGQHPSGFRKASVGLAGHCLGRTDPRHEPCEPGISMCRMRA